MYLRRSLNVIISYMLRNEQESFEGNNGGTCSDQVVVGEDSLGNRFHVRKWLGTDGTKFVRRRS